MKTAGKLEHFKTLTKNDHSSAIAHQVNATGHTCNIKWDHFEILASGKSDYYKLQDLNPAFNVNIIMSQWKADALLAVASSNISVKDFDFPIQSLGKGNQTWS